MSTEHNKQLVLRWKEERNQGNVNVVNDLCTPDCVLHMSGLPTPGPVRAARPSSTCLPSIWPPSRSIRCPSSS